MSREDWVAIASRLFALFLAVTLLRNIPSALSFAAQGDTRVVYAVLAVMLVLGYALCALLWFFPLTVARKLLPVMKEPRSDTAMGASPALSVGLTLLGVWVLTSALPDAIYWVVLGLTAARYGMEHTTLTSDQIAAMVATGTELVLATWLIFGSNGIRSMIERWRYAGKDDTGADIDRDVQ